MKKILTSIFLLLILTTPLFGQSSEENKFTFRSLLLINSLDYNLDENNGVGFVVGNFEQNINENNIEKSSNSFIGVFYAYAFECVFCDTFFVISTLGNGDSVFETKDGSKYTYSGLGINIFGGYQWYFDNKVSISVGLGPSYGNASKTSEDIKSSSVYEEDVEDYTEKNKFRLISPVPLLLVGYTF
jgi:hypothetical protein